MAPDDLPDDIETAATATSQLDADSVYMFLHPGWKREQRANRWHFAARWARYLPVVLVIPDTVRTGQVEEPEPRIEGARILRVVPNGGGLPGPLAGIQLRQVEADMKRSGYRQPILWLYNANFAEVFALLPAAKRIHHVTENYFDFPEMSPDYLRRTEEVTRIADLNVAVSAGCADPLRPLTEDKRLLVVTNGCDYKFYGANVQANREVSALHAQFERIAVFAGNINNRLDFALLNQVAQTYPTTLVLLIGPVDLNASAVLQLQSSMRRFQNLRLKHEVPAERLPAIYRAADMGLIPYVGDRLIAENGFPLKALEMAATGLPVVTSFMRPLLPLSPPLQVASSSGEFIAAMAGLRRSDGLSLQLRTVASANDYDRKFSEILSALCALPRKNQMIAEAANSKPLSTKGNASLKERLLIVKMRLAPSISRIVDRLPPSLRKSVIRVKRLIIG